MALYCFGAIGPRWRATGSGNKGAMTEAETRAALAAFDSVGDVERWIAEQPWHTAPGCCVVPEPLQRWRFRVEPAHGGVRVTASMDNGEPATWIVPGR